jgi:hypothetical protein
MTTLSAYLYEKSEDSKRVVFYGMAFLVPLVFISLRFNMGTDYPNYVEIFYDIASGNYLRTEPAYTLLNIVVYELGLDVQWVFSVMGFLTLLFTYKSFPKDGFAFAVFLFILIHYFIGSFHMIRQGLATAIMAYAMIYIYEKNFLKFVFFTVLATAFHLATGVILFTTYFFANKKINRFVLIFIIMLAFIIVQQGLLTKGATTVINVIAPAYSYYLSGRFGASVEGSYGMVAPLMQALIAISVIFFRERIIEKYPIANIYINLYVLYIVFYFFRFEINIFNRLQYAFVYPFILSLVYFSKTFHAKGRVFILLLLGLLYYMIFLRFIYNGDINDEHSTHVRPYQTILFDKD